MKAVRGLEDSNILLKEVFKTIKNETKKQKARFLRMLLGTLGASLLGNMLAGKGILRAGSAKKKRKRNCKSWLWTRKVFLIPPDPLTNLETQKYYQNEPRFNPIQDGLFAVHPGGWFCHQRCKNGK